MSDQIEKFASQAEKEVLAELKKIAKEEGRQFFSVLNEAMKDYIAIKRGLKPNQKAMDCFQESMLDFDELYEELAK